MPNYSTSGDDIDATAHRPCLRNIYLLSIQRDLDLCLGHNLSCHAALILARLLFTVFLYVYMQKLRYQLIEKKYRLHK